MYEELYHDDNFKRDDNFKKIFYSNFNALSNKELDTLLHKLKKSINSLNKNQLINVLKDYVPGFSR